MSLYRVCQFFSAGVMRPISQRFLDYMIVVQKSYTTDFKIASLYCTIYF